MDWRNATFTSEDCLIPCAVYVEETERLMAEHGGSGLVHHCNDSQRSDNGKASGKPGKVSIRMIRETATNITEIWWTHEPAATAYRVEVYCRDVHNETLTIEEETWLSWYAFRKCPKEKCPLGNRARVAAWNSFGVGPFSPFSDIPEHGANTTGGSDLITDDRRPMKVIGLSN